MCVSLCSSGSALSQRLVFLLRTGAVLQSCRSIMAGTLNQLHDQCSRHTNRPIPSPSWDGPKLVTGADVSAEEDSITDLLPKDT